MIYHHVDLKRTSLVGFLITLQKVYTRNEEARKKQAIEAERARKQDLWAQLSNPEQTSLKQA